MKKAKVMLTGLAVLAVVGGALAFKAKTFANHTIYCNEVIGGKTECTLAITSLTDADPGLGLGTTTEPCVVNNAVTSTQWSIISSTKTCNNSGTVFTTIDAD